MGGQIITYKYTIIINDEIEAAKMTKSIQNIDSRYHILKLEFAILEHSSIFNEFIYVYI